MERVWEEDSGEYVREKKNLRSHALNPLTIFSVSLLQISGRDNLTGSLWVNILFKIQSAVP